MFYHWNRWASPYRQTHSRTAHLGKCRLRKFHSRFGYFCMLFGASSSYRSSCTHLDTGISSWWGSTLVDLYILCIACHSSCIHLHRHKIRWSIPVRPGMNEASTMLDSNVFLMGIHNHCYHQEFFHSDSWRFWYSKYRSNMNLWGIRTYKWTHSIIAHASMSLLWHSQTHSIGYPRDIHRFFWSCWRHAHPHNGGK